MTDTPPHPIKLLVLTPNFPRWQGDFAGVFLVRLLSGLPKYGIEPIVLAPHAKGAALHEMMDGIEVIRFRYGLDDQETIAYTGSMQKQVLSLVGLLRVRAFTAKWTGTAANIFADRKIDIVAGHWLIPTGLVLSKLAEITKVPIVLSSHGTDLRIVARLPWVFELFLLSLWKQLFSWTVVSNHLAVLARNIKPAVTNRIGVVPLPMNDQLFTPDETVARNSRLIVAVTKFTAQKRVDQFIRAVAIVREKHPDIRAEVFGTGPDLESLQALIRQLKLEETVYLREPVPQADLVGMYRRAGMVVLNSIEEGFGAVLVEAMLCGTPVVGANSGGIPDIIEHDQSGLLVPPDDVPALAASMQRLVNDSALSIRLGAAGCERARTVFSADVLIRRYAEIVKNACASTSPEKM